MTHTAPELTETPMENFIATMKFVANNDLWDAGLKAMEAAGIATITVSSEPIRVLRKLITDDLMPNDALATDQRKHAQVIMECGCGMGNPGPGQGPVVPTSPDAGPDGGPLPQ